MTAAPRIAFLASTAEPAQRVRQELIARYGDCSIEEADVLCALGGDGFHVADLASSWGKWQAGIRYEAWFSRFSDESIS